MSTTRVYDTFRLNDRDLISRILPLASSFGKNVKSQIEIQIGQQSGFSFSWVPDSGEPTNTDFLKIKESDKCVVWRVSIRLQAPMDSQIHIERVEAIDQVKIVPRADLPFDQSYKLIQLVQDAFAPFERDESMDKLLGNELAEFYRKREQALLKLEELAQRNIERTEAYRLKLNQEATSNQNKMQDAYEAKFKELDGVYSSKNDDLQKREASFQARLQEIDDRNSRHARRQIRQDLKAAIQLRGKEFTLTKKTVNKRIIVHAMFILLVGSLFTLFLKSAWSATDYANMNLTSYLRVLFLTLSFLGSLIYYIRWNDSWFRRHADEEFRIKRFELDVDRASWLVEMAMEWKQDKGTEIPRELLDRLSSNLFDSSSRSDEVKHPGQDLLGALLSASTELNLNLPGIGNVRLDKKGTNEFKKAVASSD